MFTGGRGGMFNVYKRTGESRLELVPCALLFIIASQSEHSFRCHPFRTSSMYKSWIRSSTASILNAASLCPKHAVSLPLDFFR